MTEIEKMFKNVGIETEIVPCYSLNCECFEVNKGYPPFTTDKQIELIKWLTKYDEIYINYNNDKYNFNTLNYYGEYKKDFEEALASVINNDLWQSLTDQEKEEIRRILNE